MSHEVKLKCECGKVKGKAKNIAPNKGNHITCMCDDCQTFAHYLKRNEELLDEYGGTEIFQVTTGQIEITEGKEHLKPLRLGPKGPYRWFTTCCNTPVANTIALNMSFAGVIVKFMNFDNEQQKAQLLGPIKYRCMSEFAKKENVPGGHKRFPPMLFFKVMKNIFLGKVTKSYLPNAFFNEQTGEPISSPVLIDKELKKSIKEVVLAK